MATTEAIKRTRDVFNNLSQKFLDAVDKSTDSFSEMKNQAENLSDEIKDTGGLTGLGTNLQEKLTNSLQNIPLIGDTLTGDTGKLDRDSLLFVRPVTDALNTMSSKAKNVFMNMSAYGKTALLGVAAIITAAAITFKKWDDELESFIDDVGLGRRELRDLTSQSQMVYLQTAKYGSTMGEILGTTKALIQEYGSMAYLSQEIVATTEMIREGFGLSEENAAKLVRLQTQSLGFTQQQVKDYAVMAKQMSKTADVAPHAIMASIAENSEAVAKFSKGTGENILEAAIHARTLGAEFSDLTSMAENLMDIESSMQSAMEAQFFFGTKLNMGLARQQAIQGDLKGMSETILSDLSRTIDLNNLNYLQRKKLADVMGVSADKAMQMVRNFERSQELTEEMGQVIRETGSFAEEMELSQMQTALNEFWNLLKYSFAPLIKPLLSAITWTIDKINKGLYQIGRFLNFITGETAGWSKELKVASGILRGLIGATGAFFGGRAIFRGIKGIFGGAKGIGGAVSKLTGKGTGRLTGFVNKMNPKRLIAVGFAMIELAGAVWIISKAMQNFSDGVDWKGVALGVTTMFSMVGAVAALGALMMSGIGAGAILAGAGALTIISGAMWVASKAMQGFAKAGQMVMPILETLKELKGRQLLSVAAGIGAVGLALTGFSGAAMVAGITSLVTAGVFSGFLNLAKQAGKFNILAQSLQVLSGMSGSLHFSKMATEIELLVEPLKKVADEANAAKREMLGLAGASSANAVVQSVGKLLGVTEGTGGRGSKSISIQPADVILDGKKVAKIIFNKWQGE